MLRPPIISIMLPRDEEEVSVHRMRISLNLQLQNASIVSTLLTISIHQPSILASFTSDEDEASDAHSRTYAKDLVRDEIIEAGGQGKVYST